MPYNIASGCPRLTNPLNTINAMYQQKNSLEQRFPVGTVTVLKRSMPLQMVRTSHQLQVVCVSHHVSGHGTDNNGIRRAR